MTERVLLKVYKAHMLPVIDYFSCIGKVLLDKISDSANLKGQML